MHACICKYVWIVSKSNQLETVTQRQALIFGIWFDWGYLKLQIVECRSEVLLDQPRAREGRKEELWDTQAPHLLNQGFQTGRREAET